VDGSSYVGLNPPTAPTAVLHHYRGHQRITFPTAFCRFDLCARLRPPRPFGLTHPVVPRFERGEPDISCATRPRQLTCT
jgi:hypothetical protein